MAIGSSCALCGRAPRESRSSCATAAPSGGSLRENRIAGERAALVGALEQHDPVVSRAAKALGPSRQAFYKAMQRTGLVSRQRFGARPAASTSDGPSATYKARSEKAPRAGAALSEPAWPRPRAPPEGEARRLVIERR